ncbi:group III truncated hemoglobin [Fodinibius sp. Rm-B-1B1-1]|uniref:group III truncated hemoglobin n=1 Tax=Fodinibius alkaliphilus TaxID=3140241 RepID=UPI003159DEB2
MCDIENEQDVAILVHSFYEKVQNDERLGYIFDDYAQVDWDKHLPKMIDFWSNLLFQTGRYTGRPFRQHIPLPIKKGDFDRWYGLFEKTVDKNFSGEKATLAKELARNIASSFEFRMEKGGLIQREQE